MNYVGNNPVVGKPVNLERMFDNGVVGGQLGEIIDPGTEPDETVYAATVRAMIDDAKSFEESTLGPAREENLKYFYGDTPSQEGEGKSSAVSTDFRDTVMAILPSLIRIFTSTKARRKWLSSVRII